MNKKLHSSLTEKRLKCYRPGQPNWEYTMWNFQEFSATQILGEINFGLYEAPKTAILTVYLNFEVLGILDIFKCEIFSKNQNSMPSKLLNRQF